MAVNKVGASTASRTGSPRPHAVEENRKSESARTPRLREAEGRRVDTASSSPRRIDASKMPTLELRRLAAEEGLLPRSPRRDSPRPDSPCAPASPQPQPRSGKRAGEDIDAGDDAPQRKKARTDADGAQAGAAIAPSSSAAARPRAGSGLKAMFRKEKKPSREELRCDPDEEGGVAGDAFQPQAARLPRGGSIIFSRGAIETTLLDSTTEGDVQQPSGAPGAKTDNG